jgi:hypothetical protein
VRQSLELFDPLIVPGLDEHTSLSLSSSLKYETNPPPLESSFTLDQVLEPSFPPPSEDIPISNQTPKRGKKKSHRRKCRLVGRSLAFGHHAREKPLASIMQSKGRLSLETHIARSDPHLRVIPMVT